MLLTAESRRRVSAGLDNRSMSLSSIKINPVRPEACDDRVDDLDEGYASVHNGPVMADESKIVEPIDEVAVAEDDEFVQVPQPHSEPGPPSGRE